MSEAIRMYLVGGAVRDRLLGREPADQDYIIIGADEAALRARIPGLIRVGRNIPVFVSGSAQYTLSEYGCIEEDLASRDLSINAMAEDEEGRIVALPGALEDLRQKILRPVAVANFQKDPLRVLRAARFAAQFPDFTVHPDMIRIMRAIPASALGAVAAERVGQETLKACAGKQPGNFLRLLVAGEALAPWFRELQNADNVPAGPPQFHDCSVLEHTARVMDGCAGDALAVWMAFCHDLGKTQTPPEELPSHHGHETRGATLANTLGHRIRLPERFCSVGALAARWHMAAGRYQTLRASTKIRLLLTLDRAGALDSFFAVVLADGGENSRNLARGELNRLRAVRLPEKHQNQGTRSADILLQLRCEALREKCPKAQQGI